MEHPIVVDSKGRIGVSLDLKSRIVSKYISSAAGRAALASSMAAPIRRSLNYAGIARRALSVQQLPVGALSFYDRDIDVATVIEEPEKYKHDAIVIGSDGKSRTRSQSFLPPFRKVIFPTFDIVSNPTVRLGDVKRRRFNVIDRAVQKARQEIMNQEDDKIFQMLDNVSTNYQPLVTVDSITPGDKDESGNNQ